jgi:ketosteroid isomerase-like protein
MSGRLDIARAYLQAIERNETTESFFAPDIEQVEYTDRLNPNGGRSGLAEMKARAERGRGMLHSRAYDVRHAYEQGDTVILEVGWSATFNVAVGTLPAGDTMRAHFAVFLDFEGNRIRCQRNYDCFEPF